MFRFRSVYVALQRTNRAFKHDALASKQLVTAAMTGETQVCLELLDMNSNLNEVVQIRKGGTWTSALHAAASKGHVDTCMALLDSGAEVNLSTPTGRTPLMAAAQAGEPGAVTYLLEMGAVKCLPDTRGSTVVTKHRKNSEVPDLLQYTKPTYITANDITRDELQAFDLQSLLMHAAANNIVDELAMLLTLGACPNTLTQVKATTLSPLQIAAANGHLAACITLLDGGADVNLPNKKGTTPLKSATVAGHDEVVGFLAERGAKDARMAKKESDEENPFGQKGARDEIRKA
eukprot:TRINITY_DN171_c0_g3_i2.p2 TRINITY_DN171_c0_g3~~TRINITY_DN171_c0_g3_i2.p2  ORF type:complete len:290 (+),score=73.78 TRINITY_DN171_c0_g3_i2:104-973(+)